MNQVPSIFDAIEFASQAHRGQYRKGGRVPFIVHPLNVARILVEAGGGEVLAVAGVLHDTVEDTSVTLEDIRQSFGEDVERLVRGATDLGKGFSWEQRKEHTLQFLHQAARDSLMLGLADKLDNIRSIRADLRRMGDDVWKQFRRPRDQQRWYYESLDRVFEARLVEEPGLALARDFSYEVRSVFDSESR